MKKILTTFILFCFLWTSKTFAQYSFNVATAPYVGLASGTSFHPYTSVDTFIVPGFQVTINGITNDTLFVRIPFGRCNMQMPNTAAVSFYPFNAEQIGGSHQYTVNGTQGNRILKLQFKNIRFAHDFTNQDSINYQVWFFESGSIIEIHFGPNNVVSPQSYYIPGTGTASGAAIGFYGLWLTGNPASPTTTASPGSTLNGTPSNGTVYRFTPATSGIPTNGSSTVTPPVLFPNPATDRLFFKDKPANMEYVVTNISGKIVLNGHAHENQVDISKLPTGTYIIRLFSGNTAIGKYHFVKT